MQTPLLRALAAAVVWFVTSLAAAEAPFFRGAFIAPPENLHNHGSCLVEAPNGDLLVCWFNGTGERTADDCKILGARLVKGATQWSERFVMADTPGLPDTNCCMFIDPRGRLWLIWPTILDNHWESALLKVRISEDYAGPGAPIWKTQDVLHVKPGPEFAASVIAAMETYRPRATEPEIKEFIDYALSASQDKLKSRLGWMTRAHPFVLDGLRLIVPLYSDGFNFSLMAITDDWAPPGTRARLSSARATSSPVSSAAATVRSSPSCATTASRPSASSRRLPRTAARRGAPSPTPNSPTPAPVLSSSPSPTATGS